MPTAMASMKTESPGSAALPPLLASRLSTANKILAPSVMPLQTHPVFTHKEWVIPPRPKPGRKPAADTPPTKRKAQNRQAQRAFRERRAARVSELEEQMKHMEEEDMKEQNELRAQTSRLQADLHSQNELLLSWRHKIQELEAMIAEERRLRQISEAETATYQDGQNPSSNTAPLGRKRLSGHERQIPVQASSDITQSLESYQDEVKGCGKCVLGSRCECIEQAFDIGDFAADPDIPSKRAHSPPSGGENKRSHHGSSREYHGNEIDFTSRFSSKKSQILATSSASTSVPIAATSPDPCGFCQLGTPCICAEMAMEADKLEHRSKPAFDRATSSNPCINGPGTCDRCLSDANSTLFCKSLAASRPGYRPNRPASSEAKVYEEPNEELPPTPSSNTDYPSFEPSAPQPPATVTLSCADAYETLSRHPAFEKASEELSTWMPQLATVPGGRERTAFEVEAASVMGVLKFFDRRFGKSVGKRG